MCPMMNNYKPLIMGTVVTPPNANPNSEFADIIGTLEAPACSSKVFRIGKTYKKRRNLYVVLVVKGTTLF